MKNAIMAIAATACFFTSVSQASAKEVAVEVDARAGPWDAAINKKILPYGRGDGQAPVLVPLEDDPVQVEIYVSGQTSVPGTDGVPSTGIEGEAVDDTVVKKKRYPSFYTPKVLYPTNRHALMGIFVDANGMAMGRPFPVGEGARVAVPLDAAALSLGFNDVTFAKNSGALQVVVVY